MTNDREPQPEKLAEFSVAKFLRDLSALVESALRLPERDPQREHVFQLLKNLSELINSYRDKSSGKQKITENLSYYRQSKTLLEEKCGNQNPYQLYPEATLIPRSHHQIQHDLYSNPRATLNPNSIVSDYNCVVNQGRMCRVISEELTNGESLTNILADLNNAFAVYQEQFKPKAEKVLKASNKMRLAILSAIAGLLGANILAISHETGCEPKEQSKIGELLPKTIGLVGGMYDQPENNGSTATWEKNSQLTKIGEKIFQKDDKYFFQQPDGSLLYIPGLKVGTNRYQSYEQDYTNKEADLAYIVPEGGRFFQDNHAIRYPIAAIQELGLFLADDGYWRPWLNESAQDDYSDKYVVLAGGHLLRIKSGKTAGFIPFHETTMHPLSELSALYQQPINVEAIDTAVPSGYVDVQQNPALKTIKCDLAYATHDNTVAGVPLYPEDYPCLVPEKYVDDLASIEKDLIAHGYHLGIGDAKRPIEVQRYLYSVMPQLAADPDKNPPHVSGEGLDLFLTDLNYFPVLSNGFGQIKENPMIFRSPRDLKEAKRFNWSESEYASWKIMADACSSYGYYIIRSERWHAQRKK